MDKILIKRGTKEKLEKSSPLSQGELFLAKDEERLYVGGPKGNISIPIQQDLDEITADLEQRAFNVKQPPFNAKGNGIDDDTEAIRAAVNAVNNTGGGIVIIPKGTYNISSPIEITESAVRIVGSAGGSERGDVTVLKATNGNDVFRVTPSSPKYRIRFEHLSIMGENLGRGNYVGTGIFVDHAIVDIYNCHIRYFDTNIHLDRAWLSTVDNCVVRDGNNGIKLLWSANGVQIRESRINNNVKGINMAGSGTGTGIYRNSFEYNDDAIYIGDISAPQLRILDNYFEANYRSCIRQEGVTNERGIDGLYIEKNIMQHDHPNRVSDYAIFIENCNGAHIEKNDIFTGRRGDAKKAEMHFGERARKVFLKDNFRHRADFDVLYDGVGEVIVNNSLGQGQSNVLGSSINFVRNSSFENDLKGWETRNGATAEIVTSYGVSDGQKAVRVYANGYGGETLRNGASLAQKAITEGELLDYVRGKYVVVKVDVKLESSTMALIMVDDNRSKSVRYIPHSGTFYVTHRVATDASFVRVNLVPDATSGGSGTAIFDSVVGNIGMMYSDYDEGRIVRMIEEYGPSSERPSNPEVGRRYFDTTLGKPIWCKQKNPVVWVDAMGNEV